MLILPFYIFLSSIQNYFSNFSAYIFNPIAKSLTYWIIPPASIVSNPSLDGIVAYSLISSKSALAPLIIPTLISALSFSLANLEMTLIGSNNSLPNSIALGPSKNPSKSIFKSSKALFTRVFL